MQHLFITSNNDLDLAGHAKEINALILSFHQTMRFDKSPILKERDGNNKESHLTKFLGRMIHIDQRSTLRSSWYLQGQMSHTWEEQSKCGNR